MRAWRELRDDGARAARGLATDEVLADRAGSAEGVPTLRLYTYRAHAALVGRFQDPRSELCLERCAAAGVEVNRRPTGGGAILMGPDQLGVALAVSGRGRSGVWAGARRSMRRFSEGIVDALAELGIAAAFRGKNDLAVDGRKICGLGLARGASGGLLLHASLLVGVDTALLARLLRMPSGLDRAEVLDTRLCSVRGLLGRAVPLDEVRDRVARGFAASFGVELERGALTEAEDEAIDRRVAERYGREAWVQHRSDVPDADGAACVRTGGGLVEARVRLAGSMLKAVHVRGDFFADERALADLEGRLRWHPARAEAVRATVREWAGSLTDAGTLEAGAVADALVRALLEAIAGSGVEAPARDAGATEPYGCFVSPGGGTDEERSRAAEEALEHHGR